MRKKTKAQRVLEYIGKAPVHGRSFTEIQRFVVECLNGKDWYERPPVYPWFNPDKDTEFLARRARGYRWRGYWCDYLGGKGRLLDRFCLKNDEGRWLLSEPIGPPFHGGPETVSSRINRSRREREWKEKVASWPKCPNCGEHIRKWSRAFAPDGRAHFRIWSAADEDCIGRIWFEDRLTGLDRARYRAGYDNVRTAAGNDDWEWQEQARKAWLQREADEFAGRSS